MQKVNQNCSFCLKNDINTEIITENSIVCLKCSFDRDNIYNYYNKSSNVSLKINTFSDILFNFHISKNIIEEIDYYYAKYRQKIKGNINLIYLYAIISEKIFQKFNCPRTKEELIFMFNLDKQKAQKNFFHLNKYLSFPPVHKENYSLILFRIFDQKEFLFVSKFSKNRIFDIVLTLENNIKNPVPNFKILIILTCLYVLKLTNEFKNNILSLLLSYLEINKYTVNKYIKRNVIKEIITVYKEIKQ